MKKSIYFIAALFLLAGCSHTDTRYAVVQEKVHEGVIDQNGELRVKPVYKKISNVDMESAYFNHPHYVNLHWIHDDEGKSLCRGTREKREVRYC